MKLLLDDKATRGHDLNANEACIFAAILKCTRAGRGWYGNYRELAAAMPFVMSRQTASRAVDKLLTLGLIEVRENETLFAVQNGHVDDQNGRDDDQNGRENVQIVLPPNNPPIIINNMNEKEKEQQHALCARDCEEQQGADLSFEKFWNAYKVNLAMWPNRKEATRREWNKRSDLAKKALIDAALKNESDYGTKNPVFFVQDFPEPQPHFLSGQEQDECKKSRIPLVQVKYDGKFLICTKETMNSFGLEFVRDW